MSCTLKAAMSTPVASCPDSSAWTSVVPEPANGSSTRPPVGTYRASSASTSCGMNFPKYGWSLWTCFVRSRSGRSRSDHESSRSMSAYSWSCVAATRRASARAALLLVRLAAARVEILGRLGQRKRHGAGEQRATAAHDEVELVARDPDVLPEDPVGAKAVMPTRFALARVPHAGVPHAGVPHA